MLLAVAARPASAEWQQFAKAKDGLPGQQVWAIAQGLAGAIGFGTDQGAGIFDGERWTSYTDSLPNRFVRSILQDKQGVWWFGTSGGLASFDGIRWAVIDNRSGLPNNQVISLMQDRTGDLWVGTARGLARRRSATGTWEQIADAQLANPQVNALFEDSRRRLWIASPEGVTEADPTRSAWTRYLKDPNALAQDSVFSVGEDREGGIWFGATSGAVRFGADGTWKSYLSRDGLPTGDLLSIQRDSTGGTWFGGADGLARFDGRSFRRLRGVPGDGFFGPVVSLLVDDPGNLWVGTVFNGAYRNDGSGIEDFVSQGSSCKHGTLGNVPVDSSVFASGCLSDLLEDHRGEMWFATSDAGIARLDAAGNWSTIHAAPGGLASDAVNVMVEDPDGALWLGLMGLGVARLDSTRTLWSRFSTANGLVGDTVVTLSVDASRELWVGTSRGVSRGTMDGWTTVLRAGQGGFKPDLTIRAFVEDAQNEFWIETDQGLWSVSSDRSQLTPHGVSDGLSSDAVRGLLRAADGTLWVGTPEGIAHRKNGGWEFRAVSRTVGSVRALSQDRSGAIWVAGENGVAVYDGIALREYSVVQVGKSPVNQILSDSRGRMWFAAAGGLAYWNGGQWRQADANQGLASPDLDKMIEDSQGRLWLIGLGGLTMLAPDRTGPQTVFRLPPASITTSRNLSFAFGAAYGETADLEFLPEFDGSPQSDWSTATSFSIAGISDGHHVFAVRSRDWNRNEDPTPASIAFEVDATPPQAVVSSPTFGQPVRGIVTIEGNAADSRYLAHLIEVRPVGRTNWDTLVVSTQAVTRGTLTHWDTRPAAQPGRFPDGEYEIRLSVSDSLGLVGTALVRVIVDNVAPFADVTSPVRVRATQGGDVFTTNSEVHAYFPPLGFDGDATISIVDTALAGPSALPDGTTLAGKVWRIDWGNAHLTHDGVLDMAVPTGVTQPLAIYSQSPGGTWERLGGGGAAGAPLSVPLRATGFYALFAGGVAPTSGGLSGISLVPRAFSPRGSFGSRDVAIGFSLGRAGSVNVKVYNRAGRLVRVVADGLGVPAGAGIVRWDGRDRDGNMADEGLYLVTIEALGDRSTQTLAVVK